MLSGLHIGRIKGIQLQVHWTWLLQFLFVTWVLRAGMFPQELPGHSEAIYWLLGMTAALLLGASLIAHELAHSLVAQRSGVRIKSITLFALGGVAMLESEPPSAKSCLATAAAGPLVSLGLAVLLLTTWAVVGDLNKPFGVFIGWLGTINLVLAVFNLLPGYPLDGGRILEALTWLKTGNRLKARRVAAKTGIGVGYAFILGGGVIIVLLNPLSGIWLTLIGFFIVSTAGASLKEPLQK